MDKGAGDYITLQQFLKLKGLVSTGGEAKNMIQNEEVMVNHQIETRRGRKLHIGDEVQAGNQTLRVEE